MICPRCSVAEISPQTQECVLCGYTIDGGRQVTLMSPDPLDERVKLELAGQFDVERQLGPSATGRIYLANETATARGVALHVIPRDANWEPSIAQRFLQAAQVGATLDHAHIVPVYGSGSTRSLLWYTTKLVDGRSLADVIRETAPMELNSCLRIMEQVAGALDYAHRRGVIHGGLGADCVVIDPQGWVFVRDFGIQSALVLMPVQRQGGPTIDQRDLAILLSECLKLQETDAGVPGHVMHAIRRAMSAQPLDRFATVVDFVSVLGSAKERTTAPEIARAALRPSGQVLFVQKAPRRRRVALYVAAALVVAGGAAAALWYRYFRTVPQMPAFVKLEQPVVRTRVDSLKVRSLVPFVQGRGLRLDSTDRGQGSQTTPRPERPAAATREPAGGAPQVSPRAPSAPPGKLFVSSTPWGQLYVDGQLMGNTPKTDLEIAPGEHTVRIVREGFDPFERRVQVASGQEIRLTDVVLSRP